MKNEMRTTVMVSVVLVGVLALAGIISCMIIKRRKKGMEEIEAIQRCEALQKYLETGVEIDQGTMDVNVDPRMRQKLMSTRSRHRKERISLPLNSRRFRFSKFQSSGQQSTNINVNNEVGLSVFISEPTSSYFKSGCFLTITLNLELTETSIFTF
ncbi:hypothetical protein QQG55_5610 [Brugia pahangi]|uniref:Uncharacterized protein n=1 Tax=Brugia pahangi TaxID=6280 RepID=A0A0N4TIT8_BRUPA|nr:unnamed protein product [Brugia pahangi]